MSSNGRIKEFFKDQTVFLTGGSGFLGKILIEKLLRECEGIKKIYVLMRPKKNKTPEQRFNELFDYACFDVLKSKNIKLLEKVSLVNGDCQQPFLGLMEQDIEILLKETTCVIHAAANVKFDQPLKEAIHYVRATRDLLELAKKMSNLKVFVFVSTAFSNCVHSHIKEEFYEPPMKSEQLLQLENAVDNDTLQAITPKLLRTWPNTYVFTKSILEDLIKTMGKDLPITIVRPAIVTGTTAEPIVGWIDNFYGIIGVVMAIGLGVIRTLHGKLNSNALFVPVDYVSNCVLAAAWKREKDDANTIYNFVGHKSNHITWGKFTKTLESCYWNAPTEKAVWYYCFRINESKAWHKVCIFFLHIIPAYIADFVLLCLGKPTIAVSSYQRLHKMLDLLSYFSAGSWNFEDANVMELWNVMDDEDKRLFAFNMQNFDYDNYLHNSVMGGRLHLLKEAPESIPKAKRKIMKLFVVHYAIVGIFYYILYKFIMFVIRLLF